MPEQHFQALEDKIDHLLMENEKLRQENRGLKQTSVALEKKNQAAGNRLDKVIKQLKELDQTTS